MHLKSNHLLRVIFVALDVVGRIKLLIRFDVFDAIPLTFGIFDVDRRVGCG